MKTTLKTTISSMLKGRTASALITAAAMVFSTHAGADSVSQTPLSLSVGVPPNIIFSLDESGSMSWSFVPDTTHQVYKDKIGSDDSRRMRAVNANPMAYDPSIIYEIPPAYETSGNPLVLTTSFIDAPLNGFWVPSERNNNNGRSKQDLRTNYRLAREHRLGNTNDSGTLSWADHPADFECRVELIRDNQTKTCSVSEEQQIEFRVTRTGTSTCNAKYTLPDGKTGDAPCSGSRRNNNYTATLRNVGVPAYYYEFDPTMDYGNCAGKIGTKNEGGEKCHRIKFVHEGSAYSNPQNPEGSRLRHVDGRLVDGRENFAIWYSFYRSRALATLSAASIAFDDLSNNVRFTWQNLDTCTTFTSTTSGTGACGDNRIKPYTTKHKGEFYSWLRRIYFNKGTPLLQTMRRAGEYLKTETPWQAYPHDIGGKNTEENTYACRSSYHVLMTDGMWNVARDIGSSARSDESTFTTEGGAVFGPKEYKGQRPFVDSAKNTLADYAMHYWATDLQKDLDNKVPPYMPERSGDEDKDYWNPKNNPAEWQHMSNFIMGLGLSNALSSVEWGGATHAGDGYKALVAGAAEWPRASSNHQNNVYDLWHAAINSRGEFYSVDSPQAMVQAFKDILNRIAERESTAAKPGVSSSMEEIDDPFGGDEDTERLGRYFYHTSYDSAGWSGDLRKTRLVRECVAHEIEGIDPDADPEMVLECEEVTSDGWRASEQVPVHDERSIYIAKDKSLAEFNESNVGSVNAFNQALNRQLSWRADGQTTTLKEHIDYLRGDRTNEISKPDLFRSRNSVLGDMLGSSPAFAGGPKYISQVANKIDSGYEALVTKANNRPSMIYVGANDGMLHGFDANTGKERFAFIPTAVAGKLLDLINPNYSHRFYVDGSPVVADAYNGTEWRTILVGTLGAGGKGIFALDVTDPEDITLLWELNEGDVSGQVQPGYSFPEPTVARMHNGRWAVITGNGYEGAGTNNGKAALFVIDAFTGETRSLEVTSEAGGKNGLSTPRVVDLDGDGVADYAYAGDLQGNLWRFDLLGASASGESEEHPNGYFGGKNDGDGSTFKASYNGTPLFVAKDDTGRRQPITAPPSVVRHPSGVGYMVVAGTGKYFEVGDDETTALNSLYGIWDRNTRGPSDLGDHVAVTRDKLQKQEVTTQSRSNNAASGMERDVRVLSSNNVDWANADNSSGKLGWYLDLRFSDNKDGEMVIEGMRTLGNMLLFQTLLPNDDPCADGSSTWLYALNPATGGSLSHDPFGYDRVEGGVVSGISFGSEGGFSLSQGELDFSVHSGGEKERINPPPESMGRQTWRLIHNP